MSASGRRVPSSGLVHGLDPGAGDHAAVPDHDHLGQPELVPHHRDDLGERGGVAGVAGEHPDRDRAALRVGEQPVLDLQFPFLAVPGVAAGGQRAVPAFQPRDGQVEQRHLRRVRRRGQVPGREFGLDRVLPVLQPVHRRVDAAGGYRGGAEVGAQGGVIPPGQGGQLGGRGDDPGDDQGQRQVAFGAGRAEQRGQPELDGHRVDGGDVPVRQRPQDRHRAGGGHQGGAFQRRLDRVDHGLRQPGQVRQRLVADFAAVAVGAPQVPGLVVAPLSFLVGVAAADPGHVHRRRLSCHDPDDIGECRLAQPESKIFLATLYSPQATVYAGQDRNLYAELRQLRAKRRDPLLLAPRGRALMRTLLTPNLCPSTSSRHTRP